MKHIIRFLGIALSLWVGTALAVTPTTKMFDANLTVDQSTFGVLAQQPFTAPRVLTLPYAGGTQIGQSGQSTYYSQALTFLDPMGAVSSSNTLTITPQPGNTINGSTSSVVINYPRANVIMWPVSGSDWYLTQASSVNSAPVLPLSVPNGGTGGSTASGTLLDNITAFSGTGLLNRTGAGTYAFVTLPLSLANGGSGNSTGPIVAVRRQIFTSSGTYTPSTGMLYAQVEGVGGGAGGGGCAGTVASIYSGGGGGSGGYSRSILTAATIGASKVVTIGALGAGGTSGANTGTAGGNTCISTTVACGGTVTLQANGGSGGIGGSGGSAPSGGAGATVGTGDIAASGNPGLYGSNSSASLAAFNPSGTGGSSYFGGGAQGVSNGGNLVGAAATNYGSGGSGGNCYNIATNAAGGAGSAGLVLITEFANQ